MTSTLNSVNLKVFMLFARSALLSLIFAANFSVADGAKKTGNLTAHQTVEIVTQRLVADISQKREVYKKTPSEFNKAFEEVMSPSIDYVTISRGIMGAKAYDHASEEQRKKFVQAFKDKLIKTYSKGLADFDNQKIEVLPPGQDTNGKKKVVVKQKIYGKDGIYPMDYSMTLNKDGKWRLFNLTVNGVNLGITYRNQFSQAMKDFGGDIDKVISIWGNSVEAPSS